MGVFLDEWDGGLVLIVRGVCLSWWCFFKMTVDCMGWESRFLGYTMHVIFDHLHKTQHIRLWWWGSSLLVLSMLVACVP